MRTIGFASISPSRYAQERKPLSALWIEQTVEDERAFQPSRKRRQSFVVTSRTLRSGRDCSSWPASMNR
jgi:hypothetical protein